MTLGMRDERRGLDRSARWIARVTPGMHPDAPKRNVVVALCYLLGLLFVAVTVTPPLVIGVVGIGQSTGWLVDRTGSDTAVRLRRSSVTGRSSRLGHKRFDRP